MQLDRSMVQNVRTAAVCGTDHPAEAVTVLIVAAAEILAQRFAPPAIAMMLNGAIEEALELAGHAATAGKA